VCFDAGLKVTGGKMTPAGRLGAFITKVKRGSIADVVGHLKSGSCISCRTVPSIMVWHHERTGPPEDRVWNRGGGPGTLSSGGMALF